jgi:hypothetical protein
MASGSDESSSYEESDSSDVTSDKVWTCDDIYPAKGNAASDSDEYSSSSEASFDESDKVKGKVATQEHSSSSESNDKSSDESESESEDDSDSVDDAPIKLPESQKNVVHSSREIDGHLKAQSKALVNTKIKAEDTSKVSCNKDVIKRPESQTPKNGTKDTAIENLMQLVAQEHAEIGAKKASDSGILKEEKAKFEKRNVEREMRLAKARERIEKKKDDEAAKVAKERLKEKEASSKLDMSKAARVERAYSWYSRMAMPTREKMKERVEYMPASSGVTPDDVDLLPWNARGSFVSVAAMMRMNRTASNLNKKSATSSIAESETDSD